LTEPLPLRDYNYGAHKCRQLPTNAYRSVSGDTKTAVRFAAITLFHNSSVVSRNGTGEVMPANYEAFRWWSGKPKP